jgi:HSP20 family molecular chaperone IbpA
MAAIDSSFLLQPTVSPHQNVEVNLFSSNSFPIRITRIFDIRQVHNSESEIHLSFDVPAGVDPSELRVCIEHDKQEDPNVYRLRVAGINSPTAKTFPLNAQSIDLHKVEAVLRNDVLDVIAPKRRNSTGNALLVMAVEALQSLALSVSNTSWNNALVFREVPIREEVHSSIF